MGVPGKAALATDKSHGDAGLFEALVVVFKDGPSELLPKPHSLGLKLLDAAEVQEGDLSVGLEHVVSRVWVRVEDAVSILERAREIDFLAEVNGHDRSAEGDLVRGERQSFA